MSESPKKGNIEYFSQSKKFDFAKIIRLFNRNTKILHSIKGDGKYIAVRYEHGKIKIVANPNTVGANPKHPFQIVCDGTDLWVRYGTLQGLAISTYTGVPSGVTIDYSSPTTTAISTGKTIILKVHVNGDCEIKSSEIIVQAGVGTAPPADLPEVNDPSTDGYYHWVIGDIDLDVDDNRIINQGTRDSIFFKCCGDGTAQFLKA